MIMTVLMIRCHGRQPEFISGRDTMKDYAKLKKLTDDELEKVSAGYDDDGDNTRCSASSNGSHDWYIGDNGKLTCRNCLVYMD